MKEQLIISNTYIGVVDTESDTTTGAMTSIQYAPVFEYSTPYPIEYEDAKLIRCSSTSDGMVKFHEYLKSIFPKPTKLILYCHNLKWDITFFMNYLMKDLHLKHRIEYRKNHIILNKKPSYQSSKEFDCLITNMGQTFSIHYRIDDLDITIQDSLKIIPFRLSEAGGEKAYNTKFKKVEGEDYNGILSDKYCLHDVLCLSELVAIQISEGINPKYTLSLASWCLKDYKQRLFESKLGLEYQKKAKDKKKANPSKCFRYYFPQLDHKARFTTDTREYKVSSIDAYVRQGYRGGLTYCNPRNANIIFISKWFYDKNKNNSQIKEILANNNYRIVNYISHLDVHSLYPSKCLKGYQTLHTLPIKTPKIISGNISPQLVSDFLNNKKHFMVRFQARFHIKPDKFPSIQIKGSYFNASDWLTSSKVEIDGYDFDYPVNLTLTDVEFFDFLDRYNVEDLEILDHIVFNVAECEDLFGFYMGYYYKEKSNTSKKNFVKYQSIKSKLNNLTGKFGSSVIASVKIPYIAQDGSIELKTKTTDEYNEILTKDSVYTPVIAWITAYGRLTLLDEMDKAGLNDYITGDTDSVFIASEERFVPTLGITDSDLNTFDEEHSPEQIAMFCASRQKTYMLLDNKGEITLKVAGMTEEQKKMFLAKSTNPFLDFSNNKMSVEGGKLIKKATPEGAIMVDTDFVLTEKKRNITANTIAHAQMKNKKIYTQINISERLSYDLAFRKIALDSYNYLVEQGKLSKENLAKMLNIDFELPWSFMSYLMSASDK